jgi:hypothetical protein
MPDKHSKRGRPAKPGKTAFNFRMSGELRRLLVESAEKSGLSLTEEAELRLKRDFGWEATKQDIEQMKRDASTWRDADHLNVLRLVGYQILRETSGRPTRLVVDLQSLLAEADGIARGLRSGFVDDNAPGPSPSAERTADEEQRLLQELERAKRRYEEAVERTRAADEAARKSGKVA